eukprot:PhF_6_TR40786/c0_g1_i1/m.61587
MKISLYYVFVFCLTLAIASAVLSAVLVYQGDHSAFDNLKKSQRDSGEGQLFGITLFVVNYMTFMKTNTESNVRLLQYMAALKGPNFISTPKTFAKDINDTLMIAWLPAAGSLYQPFWSYTSLYPAYWTDNWTVAQAAQHWVDYHHNGERWQYMSLPEDQGATNQSWARRITWTQDMKPIVHDPPDYSFSSYSALGNISGVDWFTPMYPWIALDGNSYWYFTHQTGVRINGVMTVVQTMDDAIRWQLEVDELVGPGSHMIVTDSYKKVIVTTLPEEKKRLASCTDDVNAQSFTNGAAPCIDFDADNYPISFVTQAYSQARVEAWENMDLDPAPMRTQYFPIDGVEYLVMSQTVFNQNELRVNVIWLQPAVTMDQSAREGVYVGIAMLAFLPTLILCVISVVSILLPLRRLGSTMINLTDSLISLENKTVEIPQVNTVFSEMDTVGSEFETLGTTVIAISKYIPKQLVRHELGVTDDNDAEDNLSMSKSTSMSSSRSRSMTPSKYDQSRRMTGTMSATNKMHMAKIGTSMQKKNVAVLFLNVRGFHENADELLPKYPTIVKQVETSAAKHKGIMDYFHGDHFMLTFNGMSPCGAPLKAAASAFGDISGSLKKESKLTSMSSITSASLLHVRFTGGLCAGVSSVGQMGSDTAKRFCTLSPVVSTAAFLQSQCTSFTNSECLTPAQGREEIQPAVYYYYSGKVLVPGHKSPITVLTIARSLPKGDTDEWMYELEAGDSSNPYSMVNGLWERALKTPKDKELIESATNLQTAVMPESEVYPAVQDLLKYINSQQ